MEITHEEIQTKKENLVKTAPSEKTIKLSSFHSRFGEIKINKQKAINFPHGLLGIPGDLNFYLADFPAKDKDHFKILQSAEDDSLSFIVIPTDYENKLIERKDTLEACQILEIDKENLLILLIVTVHRTPESTKLSVNLRAPIMIDSTKRVATQYVFPNNKYDIRHMIA